eukprot:2041333-Ditylum_brightwellii.AAC.1
MVFLIERLYGREYVGRGGGSLIGGCHDVDLLRVCPIECLEFVSKFIDLNTYYHHHHRGSVKN